MIESKPADTNSKNVLGAKAGMLSRRIADLQLSIKGTRLEGLLDRLYRELETAGLLHFKPEAYLSDEWGCPTGVPVIGIPFYLVSPELCDLECQFTGIEAETDDEVMMYLRHESGHAFNYAHKLHNLVEWTKRFGEYDLPYREAYRVVPFSSKFVRHIPGWYAQKHPDDDFAETFAVWLTPGSNWRQVYAGIPALKKLLYVDKVARHYGQKTIAVKKRALDTPVEEITMTLDSWYKTCTSHRHRALGIHRVLDEDLRRAFPSATGEPVSEVIEAERISLIFEVNRWTGLERHILGALFDDLAQRAAALSLKIEREYKLAALQTFIVMATALAMNYVNRGKFVE